MTAPGNNTSRQGQTQSGQPPVDVSNPKGTTDWLLSEIGDERTPLAGLFNRGGQLVHARAIDGDGYHPTSEISGPAIEAVDHYKLAALVSTNYSPYIVKWNKATGEFIRVPALYPNESARTVRNSIHKAMELRELRSVTHTPLPRADGTLIVDPGYDNDSNLLYLPADDLNIGPIPDEPTAEEVKTATALLRYMVSDFPWCTAHDEANFLGVLLTPLLRELVPGPYKAAIIGARQPGSGKSLLGKILRAVHGGTMQAEFPDGDREVGNVILGILTQTTGPIVEFDNVTGILRSPKLASLLTSPDISGRMLQTTNNITVPNDRMWTFTGNNLQVGGDLTRRTTWITIDPDMEAPEKRTQFAIPDLTRWVQNHRSDILRALLTLISAWNAAGKPTAHIDSDVYGPWVQTVRGILAIAEVPGVFDHVDSVEQKVGDDDDEWGVMLHAIHDKIGSSSWTANSLLRQMRQSGQALDVFARQPLSTDILPDELRLKLHYGQEPTTLARSFGKWLKHRKGRWAAGYKVSLTGQDRHRINLWCVERRDGQTSIPITDSEFEGDAGPTQGDVEAVATLIDHGLFDPNQGSRR